MKMLRMNSKRGVCAGAVLLALAAALAGVAGAEPEVSEGRMLVAELVAPPMAVNAGCWACEWCPGGNGNRHEMLDGTNNDLQIQHGCNEDSESHQCPTHTLCPSPLPDAEELGQLWTALSSFEGEPLRAVMDAYPAVQLNMERGAFQLEGCDGTLLAHLPLSDDQLKSLRVTTDQ